MKLRRVVTPNDIANLETYRGMNLRSSLYMFFVNQLIFSLAISASNQTDIILAVNTKEIQWISKKTTFPVEG